jgi:hypothetical protein
LRIRTMVRKSFLAGSTAIPARQCALGIPDLPAAKAENSASCNASPAMQGRSNPVSGRNLPKRESFKCPPETIGYFAPENAQNRSPETGAKARHWRAFLRVSGTVSLSAVPVAWLTGEDSNLRMVESKAAGLGLAKPEPLAPKGRDQFGITLGTPGSGCATSVAD